MCQNCKLYKNSAVIDHETENNIKKALSDNVTKEYKKNDEK